jgi:hypothetical protein
MSFSVDSKIVHNWIVSIMFSIGSTSLIWGNILLEFFFEEQNRKELADAIFFISFYPPLVVLFYGRKELYKGDLQMIFIALVLGGLFWVFSGFSIVYFLNYILVLLMSALVYSGNLNLWYIGITVIIQIVGILLTRSFLITMIINLIFGLLFFSYKIIYYKSLGPIDLNKLLFVFMSTYLSNWGFSIMQYVDRLIFIDQIYLYYSTYFFMMFLGIYQVFSHSNDRGLSKRYKMFRRLVLLLFMLIYFIGKELFVTEYNVIYYIMFIVLMYIYTRYNVHLEKNNLIFKNLLWGLGGLYIYGTDSLDMSTKVLTVLCIYIIYEFSYAKMA